MLRQGIVGAGVQSLPLHEQYRGFEDVQLQRHYPQSQAVKNLLEAYRTLDLKDVEQFKLKDIIFSSFPAVPEYPDQGKRDIL